MSKPIRPIPTEQEFDVPSAAYILSGMLLVVIVGALVGLILVVIL